MVYITSKRLLLQNGSLKTVHAEFITFLSKIQDFVKLLELLCSLRRISIQRMCVARLTQFVGEWFFQSPFEANEMFCLLNKFVLFTNQKQPLKCVQQIGYLDQIPYILSEKEFIFSKFTGWRI